MTNVPSSAVLKTQESAILPLRRCAADNLFAVGLKAYNLCRLVDAGFDVPEGFIVSSSAFDRFLREVDRSLIAQCLSSVDLYDIDSVTSASEQIRSLLSAVDIPLEIERDVSTAYLELSARCGSRGLTVACRSSSTTEDVDGASGAGMHDSFLHMQGVRQVVDAVKNCWISLYTDRAIALWGSRLAASRMAVIIQRMISATKAGVLYTSDPADTNRTLSISVVWGLANTLVSGEVNPAEFIIDRHSGAVLKRTGPGDDARGKLITSQEASQFIALAKDIETLFGAPQDVEWSIADGQLFVLQARALLSHKGREIYTPAAGG